MDLLTWLIVGLVAGVLASVVVGGYGLIIDIVIGIAGAFMAGEIFVAFIGALVLLVVLHLIHAISYGPRWGYWHRRPPSY
jgi:uncharacterized membrane protein YeaQ/YmgE (transglycosylase-associated protein family)